MDIKPVTPFNDDILKLHILFLEKVDSLTENEREAFQVYMHHLANPVMYVNKDVDIEALLKIK